MTKFAASFLAMLAIAAPASATSTRVATLGGMNTFITDDANMWNFPHVVERYTHLFQLDYASCTGGTLTTCPPALPPPGPAELDEVHATVGGGALLRLQEGLGIGVWTSDFSNATLNGAISRMAAIGGVTPGASKITTILADVDGSGGADLPNRKYDLFAAYRFDPVVAGLHFTYGSVNYNLRDQGQPSRIVPNEDRKQDVFRESDISITGSVGVDLDDTMGLDAALSYSRYGFDFVPNGEAAVGNIANTQAPFNGGNAFSVIGRFRMELSDFWDLIPALSYNVISFALAEDSTIPGLPASGKREQLPDAEEFDRKLTTHMLDIGAAARLRAGERVRFWGAVGFQYDTTYTELKHTKTNAVDRTDSLDTSNLSLPYIRLALEAGLNDWLTFRGGAQKFVTTNTTRMIIEDRRDTGENDRTATTTTDVTPTTGTATFAAFVGFGVYYRGLNVDLMLDPGFFFRGPDFISGAGGALATRVSIAYQF